MPETASNVIVTTANVEDYNQDLDYDVYNLDDEVYDLDDDIHDLDDDVYYLDDDDNNTDNYDQNLKVSIKYVSLKCVNT